MKKPHITSVSRAFPVIIALAVFCGYALAGDGLKLNDQGYFEKQGLNILVFNNWYDGNFSDAKISGIEIIHHGIRTATNGDVRLSSTPGQWDPVPELIERKILQATGSIEVILRYPDYNFTYRILAEAKDNGVLLSVIIDRELPVELTGRAGFNLEFLPSAYFEKIWQMDAKSGLFPLHPAGPMNFEKGKTVPLPLCSGKKLVLAPEDLSRYVSIESKSGSDLMLFDGRNQAQNGWYVVRSLIPSGKSGKVLEWFLKANTLPDWIRKPVIAHSQAGYHPSQKKYVLIELDKNDSVRNPVTLVKINTDGGRLLIKSSRISTNHNYLRYSYGEFDFSEVEEEGVYLIEYGPVTTKPFRIASDIYENAWHPTLDVFMPVQMDHMYVNEAYRTWHGKSHMDDALQAPVNYTHFDLYAQDSVTDTPFKPGEHIPGLNMGGWFDAGDFDIRTQTHYALITILVHAWEDFKLNRDQTTIDQGKRYVNIHVPDGIPDLIQQIEHGTLALIAQHRAVGHAIPGIIAPDLQQYTHLGDAGSITDNDVCKSDLIPFKWEEFTSSNCDDRWAFTTETTPLNFGSAAALAAASRALRGYNSVLADECIQTAIKVWDKEQGRAPLLFRFGNTTGGQLEQEELTAAVELLITTHDQKYAERILALMPFIKKQFGRSFIPAALALPYMDAGFRNEIEELTRQYKTRLDSYFNDNPFGVFISRGGWAGNGQIVAEAAGCYLLHREFPEIIGPEYVFRGLHYIFGLHPDSDISFVSAVGTQSKTVAYGSNRADFSFIPGGIVPGILILKPDFPENKEDWPFFWGENEYVIGLAGSYLYLVNAANKVLNGDN